MRTSRLVMWICIVWAILMCAMQYTNYRQLREPAAPLYSHE